MNIVEPRNADVRNYVDMMRSVRLANSSGQSYIPLVILPKDQRECSSVLARIYELIQTSVIFQSNENTFKYVIGELVDNIYEHSMFKRGYVMAEKYPRLGFVELGFLDDGITIPGSFNASGYNYREQQHSKAIIDAINGLSTKKGTGRGYGLNSTMRLFQALDGEILVVSGSGAVYLSRRQQLSYYLTPKYRFKGTLVSLRVQDTAQRIDLYSFLE